MPPPSDRLPRLVEALEAADPLAGPEPAEGTSARGRHRPTAAPRLFTVPAGLRDARVRVHPRAALGAVVLVVLVLAVVGVRVVLAQRGAEPELVAAGDGASVTASDVGLETAGQPHPTAATSAPSGDLQPATPATLYVHVVGAVLRSGVVEVPAGSRVADAVEAAGGLTAKAQPSRVNLAREVTDGEHIWVPVRGADPPAEVTAPAAPVAGGAAPGTAGPTEPGAAPVDVNTADSIGLQTLPGVGPVTAEAILAWRDEHGRFTSVEELMEVSGIGPRTLEKLRPKVVVAP